MRHNPDGDNYPSISNYVSEMSLTGTYGSFCELVAATQLYPICIEVYYNGKLYVKHGNNDNPKKKKISIKLHLHISAKHVTSSCKGVSNTIAIRKPVFLNTDKGDVQMSRHFTERRPAFMDNLGCGKHTSFGINSSLTISINSDIPSSSCKSMLTFFACQDALVT
ncbi:hypothetical protein FF38_00718 [Lucilia cuprina]|uniref:Uncharacterized protein n=1 Tax=Lucilia cuprina TaxID=7375 RepID=A0A0L0BWW4_LUCCU|nr:hypothetical protein FF38_00718 [Lucilia cuprina]